MTARLPLLLHLIRAAWLDRYAASALGAGWALVWPLVQLAVFLLVFSRLMGARLEGAAHLKGWSYGVYLAAGMVPWWMFANGLARASGALLEMRGVLTKIPLPLAWIPLPALAAECLTALILLGPLLILLAALGQLTPAALWLAAVTPALLALTYGLGLIAAVLTVFLEDVREVLQVALQLGFWLTPVVYVATILPEWGRYLLAVNPAAWAVEAFHAALVFGRAPAWRDLAALWAAGLMTPVLGMWLLRRTEKALRDLL